MFHTPPQVRQVVLAWQEVSLFLNWSSLPLRACTLSITFPEKNETGIPRSADIHASDWATSSTFFFAYCTHTLVKLHTDPHRKPKLSTLLALHLHIPKQKNLATNLQYERHRRITLEDSVSKMPLPRRWFLK